MTGLSVDLHHPGRNVRARFAVPDGECVGLVGENGAGKSTIVDAIAGHLRLPRGGHVRVSVGGEELSRAPLHSRRLAYVSQRSELFATMSVEANVAYGLVSTGVNRGEATRRARDMLWKVGLEGLGAERPHRLSGGQAQRVALARALVTSPRALLLDEPFAAVDARARGELRELVRTLARDITSVVVSHDVLDIATLCSQVIVLESGRVVQDAPTESFLERPASAFAAHLVSKEWVAGEMRPGGDFVSRQGMRLRAWSAKPFVGPARALVNPRDLRARSLPGALDGAVGYVGAQSVRWVRDVPVACEVADVSRLVHRPESRECSGEAGPRSSDVESVTEFDQLAPVPVEALSSGESEHPSWPATMKE